MSELSEPLDRLLADICTRDTLRAFARSRPTADLWEEIVSLGYPDALIAEAKGGAGLNLADIADIARIVGRRLCPVPLVETMVAHALLAAEDMDRPDGPILLLTPLAGQGDAIVAEAVPMALAAGHALADLGDRLLLLPLAAAKVTATVPGPSLTADISWARLPEEASVITASYGALRPTAAALRAGRIAGMAAVALEMTVEYAATRRQFGKPIGSFQAIQQQLAVMAEEVAAADMAVSMAFGAGVLAQPILAATAKMRCSAAAHRIAAAAHGIHGAIGISEEHDLQLYTRGLAEERLADGGEAYWAQIIGEARLRSEVADSLTFVRGMIAG